MRLEVDAACIAHDQSCTVKAHTDLSNPGLINHHFRQQMSMLIICVSYTLPGDYSETQHSTTIPNKMTAQLFGRRNHPTCPGSFPCLEPARCPAMHQGEDACTRSTVRYLYISDLHLGAPYLRGGLCARVASRWSGNWHRSCLCPWPRSPGAIPAAAGACQDWTCVPGLWHLHTHGNPHLSDISTHSG